MSGSTKKRGVLLGATLGIGATLSVVLGLGLGRGRYGSEYGGAGEYVAADDQRHAASRQDARRR